MDTAHHLAQARQLILDHGWMVQQVRPCGDHLGEEETFAYSAGLTAAGLPEILVVGLDISSCGLLVNLAAKRSLTEEILDGAMVADVAAMPLRAELRNNQPAVVARQLYGNRRVRLLQLIWPDERGFYPDSPFWSLGDIQKVKEW